MSGSGVLFVILASIACCSALAVVIVQNIVRMAFWLIVSLASTAGLFFLLHADFVGATQLLVYVGGTLVLLIFGVMLTARGPFVKIESSLKDILWGMVLGVTLFFTIASTVLAINWSTVAHQQRFRRNLSSMSFNPPQQGNSLRPLGLAFVGLRPDKGLKRLDSKPATGYLLPFEIISVHLLVVLIGATYLARTKRPKDQCSSSTTATEKNRVSAAE